MKSILSSGILIALISFIVYSPFYIINMKREHKNVMFQRGIIKNYIFSEEIYNKIKSGSFYKTHLEVESENIMYKILIDNQERKKDVYKNFPLESDIELACYYEKCFLKRQYIIQECVVYFTIMIIEILIIVPFFKTIEAFIEMKKT